MFWCQVSKTLSKPREPQVKIVTETRPVTYQNLREDEVITTSGFETVKEINARLIAIDPAAAERRDLAHQALDFRHYRALAQGHYDHAKKCKKPLDECIVCKGNISFFAELPLAVLSWLSDEQRFK